MTPPPATACKRVSCVAVLLMTAIYGLWSSNTSTGKLTAYETPDRLETCKPTLTLHVLAFFLLAPRLPPALIKGTERADRRVSQQREAAHYPEL